MGMGLGMGEMVFIFLIVLLLFGAKRMPEIGSSLGKGIREFKGSISGIEQEMKLPDDRQAYRTTPPPGEEETTDDSTDDGEPRQLSDDVPGVQQ